MTNRPLFLVPAAALLVACSQDEPADRASAPLEHQDEPASPSPQDEPASPSPQDDSRSLAQLRDVPFDALLLPDRFADGAVITSGPVWYAMAYHDERNITVSIHATNKVHAKPDGIANIPPPDYRVRGVPARTTLNEGIRSVTWVADEVAYVVEVECWDVSQDRRCTEPDFALEVAEDLVPVPR